MVFNTNITTITTLDTLSISEDTYLVDASNGDLGIELPEITADGMHYKLTRIDNTTNSVTIITQGVTQSNINGNRAYLLKGNSSVEFQSFNSEWYATENKIETETTDTMGTCPRGNLGNLDQIEQIQLVPSDSPATNDLYGSSVAMTTDYAVVGCRLDDDGASNAGAVYVFRRISASSWIQEQKILAPTPIINDNFGNVVAISDSSDSNGFGLGMTIVVASITNIYIYARDETLGTWSNPVILVFSIIDDLDIFQNDIVATNGNDIRIYNYDGIGWLPVQTISLVSAVNVSLCDNRFLAGIPTDNSNQGIVNVYDFDSESLTWILSTTITASDGVAGDFFGASVWLNDTQLIVAAPAKTVNGNINAGKVYIYNISSNIDGTVVINNEVHLVEPPVAGDLFGSDVSLVGDYALVSRRNPSSTFGSVILFEKQNNVWNLGTQITINFGGSPSTAIMPCVLNKNVLYQNYILGNQNSTSNVVVVREFGPPARINCPPRICPVSIENSFEFLLAPSGTPNGFGNSVATDTNWVVVGAPNDTSDTGAVYVYHRTDLRGWEQRQILTASDATAGDEFGRSVAISGEYIFIGASERDSVRGAVYVFKLTTADGINVWEEDAILLRSINQVAGDQFGFSVSIDGIYGIVGAPGVNSGNGYFELYILTAGVWTTTGGTVGITAFALGYSVSISSVYAIIGGNNVDAISAYIYKYNGTGWNLDFTISVGAATDIAGFSVDIDQERCILGAFLDDDQGSNAGAAYIFSRDGVILPAGTGNWVQEAKLVAKNGTVDDVFGYSVAILGNRALVGARGTDRDFTDQGSAYYFERGITSNGWAEITEYVAEVPAINTFYGQAVALNKTLGYCNSVIGAPGVTNVNRRSYIVTIGAEVNQDAFVSHCLIGDNCFNAWGRVYAETARPFYIVEPDDNTIEVNFGRGVGLDGDSGVVGASGSLGGDGQIYIYRRTYSNSGWALEQQIDGATGDGLGRRIDISEFTIVAGGLGIARGFKIFDRDTFGVWTENVPTSSTGSGSVVAICDALIGAGDVTANPTFTNQGEVYAYRKVAGSWAYFQTLISPAPGTGAQFGHSISISGNKMIIGEPFIAQANPGNAHIYNYNGSTWILEATLDNSDFANGDRFGFDVSISGDYAAVGATFVSGAEGRVAIFHHTGGGTWELENIISEPVPDASNQFGNAVSISYDKLIIGAFFTEGTSTNDGMAYVYQRNLNSKQWLLKRELSPKLTPVANVRYGGYVRMNKDPGYCDCIVGTDNIDAGVQNSAEFISLSALYVSPVYIPFPSTFPPEHKQIKEEYTVGTWSSKNTKAYSGVAGVGRIDQGGVQQIALHLPNCDIDEVPTECDAIELNFHMNGILINEIC